MNPLFPFLGNVFSFVLVNICTVQLYKTFGIGTVGEPQPPKHWSDIAKSAALSSAIPILSNKPEIIIKPMKKIVGFSRDLITSDRNKPVFISSLPADRLISPEECTQIVSSLMRNPNFVAFMTTVAFGLLIKSYINSKIKERELDSLIKNHQSPVSLEQRNKMAIDNYIKKHGNFP